MNKNLEELFNSKLSKFAIHIEVCISFTFDKNDKDRMIDTDIDVSIFTDNDCVNLISQEMLSKLCNSSIKILSKQQLEWIGKKLCDAGWELASREIQFIAYESPHYVDSHKLQQCLSDFLKIYSDLVEDSDLTPIFEIK